MSSQQRSASMDATVRQVASLSAHHNRMAATIKAQGDELGALSHRLDALERLVAARHFESERFFLTRIRRMFTGR